ncbi:MAG: hypothetical protein ACTSX9_05430 [Candidatus Njordarchaeales archaeon]
MLYLWKSEVAKLPKEMNTSLNDKLRKVFESVPLSVILFKNGVWKLYTI